MRQLTVIEFVTLDGVMQGLGSPDEDRDGDFTHGGWGASYGDHVQQEAALEGMQTTTAYLFGRRTYEQLLASWNAQGGPFKDALNNSPKYVASTTLEEPLPWPNSTLLRGDIVDGLRALKAQSGGVLAIMGSGVLIGSLMAADLIDEYLLMNHPLVLGTGRRLFPGGVHVSLRLTDSVTTATGVVIATYEPVRN